MYTLKQKLIQFINDKYSNDLLIMCCFIGVTLVVMGFMILVHKKFMDKLNTFQSILFIFADKYIENKIQAIEKYISDTVLH